MPELPEVEAARRAIEDHCIGKKITKAVIANDSKVIDGVSPSDFQAALVGKTVISALRKGKNLWLVLDSPPFPSFQFGMSGAIYIKGVAVTNYKRSAVKDTDDWPSKYSKLFIELDDGLELSFTDKRRFARVRLLKDPASAPPISELGPDALVEPITVDEFYESLRKKKTAIKALLLDQSFISGIGNWIADEVLYQARIHPLQISSSLSKDSCATLHKCIKEVIEKAIEVGADSSEFPNNWIFHSREKKPGKAFVDGQKIDFISAGGRTTAYVPELQKLSGNQAGKAAGKPKKQTSKRKRNGDEDEEEDNDDDKDGAKKPVSEEDKTAKENSKRDLKPRGYGKKRPVKRKTKATDEDNEDDDDGADNHDNGEDLKRQWGKVTKNKQGKAEKASKKKVTNKKSKVTEGSNEDDYGADNDDNGGGQKEKLGRVTTNKQAKTKKASKEKVTNKKSKVTEDSNEDDYGADNDDNDGDEKEKLGKVTNNKQAKAEKASRNKVTNKKSKVTEDSNEDDYGADNDDDGDQKEKLGKLTNNKQAKTEKASKKRVNNRKSQVTEDNNDDDVDAVDNDDNDEDEKEKRGMVTRNRQAKAEKTKKKVTSRKSKVTEDKNEDDGADNDEDQKEKPGKVTNNKQAKAEKASEKKVANQTSMKPKKKVKQIAFEIISNS